LTDSRIAKIQTLQVRVEVKPEVPRKAEQVGSTQGIFDRAETEN